MGEHRKFGFDTVFASDGAVTSEATPYRRLFTHEEVDRLCAQARADGENAAVTGIQAQQAKALNQIAEAARHALPLLAQAAHEHRVGAAELAIAAARKIADAALDQFPLAPVKAALAALAREVEASPRLIVLAQPDILESLQAALEETAAAIGFSGQIIARADPALARAAFVLDWGDGKAAFDPDASAERVAQALEAALAAEGLHGEALGLTNASGDDHV